MNTNLPTPPPTVAALPESDAPPRFPFSILWVVWLAVALVGTLVTMILPESFASTARIKVERDRTDIEGLADTGARERFNPYDPYFIQTEFEIIQSETILGRVIDTVNLNDVWGKKYYDGTRLKDTEALTMLRGRLDVRPVRNTTLLDIRVFSEDPREAAELANQIAKSYKSWRLEKSYELAQGGLESLKKQAKEMDEVLAMARKELIHLAEVAESDSASASMKMAYREKEREVEEMREFRQLLTRKMNLEEIDLNLPRSAQVEIIENAVPAVKPVRPNVPLNIWLSILMGLLLGLLLAALAYFVQRREYRRRQDNPGASGFKGVRAFLRVVIALVVGVIIGYNCAMPLSTGSLLFMQLVVLLGGIAIAVVELAKPTPLPASTPPAETNLKSPPRPD